jgi:hypothetical protein
MSKQARSPYRLRARRAIREALAALPPKASRADQRKAVRDCYPFAERMGWAYQCFLRERKAALGIEAKASSPDIAASPDGIACKWCDRERNRSRCILCIPARERLERMPQGLKDEWARLIAAATDGEELAGEALADWIEEHWEGIER